MTDDNSSKSAHFEAHSPDREALRQQIISALEEIYDPEIPVSIWELGLIYRVDIINDDGQVEIDMTLTSPACPVAQELPQQVKVAAESVAGVSEVAVEVVWEPPWSLDLMSDLARLELGML